MRGRSICLEVSGALLIYPAGDGPLLLIYFLEQRLSALCILIYSTSIALPPAVIFCTSNKIFSSLRGRAQAITNGMLVRGTYLWGRWRTYVLSLR